MLSYLGVKQKKNESLRFDHLHYDLFAIDMCLFVYLMSTLNFFMIDLHKLLVCCFDDYVLLVIWCFYDSELLVICWFYDSQLFVICWFDDCGLLDWLL